MWKKTKCAIHEWYGEMENVKGYVNPNIPGIFLYKGFREGWEVRHSLTGERILQGTYETLREAKAIAEKLAALDWSKFTGKEFVEKYARLKLECEGYSQKVINDCIEKYYEEKTKKEEELKNDHYQH